MLQVINPLEQHIVAALRRKPIVDLSRAYESQLFLEQVRGYKPNQSEAELWSHYRKKLEH